MLIQQKNEIQDIQDRPGTQSTNKRHIQSHQERRLILNREYPEEESKLFRSNSNLMKHRAGQLKLFGNQRPNGNNQPKVIPQDKERLYDELMQAKQLINHQRSENHLLRTKNYSLEAEIRKQISTQYNSCYAIAPKNSEAYRGVMSELYGEDNFNASNVALLKEMKKTLKGRDETISRLSRTTNQTRMRELEIDNSNLSNETIRLQAMVTQALTLQQSQQLQFNKNGNSEKVIDFLTNDNVQMAAILKDQGRQITTLTNQSAEKGALINRIRSKLEGQTKIMKELQRELDEMRQRDPYTSGGKKQNQHKAELEVLKNDLDKKFHECNQLNNCVMKKDKRISELERRVKEVQLECQDKVDHLEQEKNQMKDKLVQNREEQLVSQSNIQAPLQKSKTNQNFRNSINLVHQVSVTQLSPSLSPNKSKFELNQINSIAQEEDEENEEIHKMNVITKQDVQQLGSIIKYRLLEMKKTLDSLDQYIFQNQDENQMISIFNIKKNLQSQPFNLSKSKALLLARYLIEDNNDNEIMFTNTRKQTLPRVRSILRNLLGGYEIPTPQQEDQLKLQIANLLHKNKVGVFTYISKLLSNLKQTFDPTSCNTTEIQEAFIATDIVFTYSQMDYLLQTNYATTQNLSIINLNQLFIAFPLAKTIRPVSQKSSQGQPSQQDPIIQIQLSVPDLVDNEEVQKPQFLWDIVPVTSGSQQRKISNQSSYSKQSKYSKQSINNSQQNLENSISDSYISQ